ncbi:hypothetical protein LTR78_003379 [Recurvomyces mirabilis]|uniref:NADH dehydrogenase [ubiquinone] 1 alpha subcomplex assembly factor 3 n=1 Tax=Recurvomyces mirabilis TaxID=574656 RepID=A0AAE0WRS6_9PEZI|nr:hypothetical protein LTR78_003379 [Recurvomyces mirabilis]KAK5154585.1 hypothetical protein LTS14_006723 [Recurvomyces mirabilis]
MSTRMLSRAAAQLHSAESRRHLHLALSKRLPSTAAPSPIRSSRTRLPSTRALHTSPTNHLPPAPPKSKDRGPASKEDTQTDFGAMDVFSSMPAPSTAIDACMTDGFALNSGLKVTGSGVLLVGGEAFKWKPWQNQNSKILNKKGQFDVDAQVWGIIDLVWPKPDLLVLGTGERIVPVSPDTRARLTELGVRIEVQDTRNAAAQFNLLATERGVQQVVGALIPVGWREGK